MMAASPPGPATVFVLTLQSYCVAIHRFEQRFGDARSAGAPRASSGAPSRATGVDGRERLRRGGVAPVERRFLDERGDLEIGDDVALPEEAHARLLADDADLRDVHAPLAEDRGDLGLAPPVDDEDHALLRLGEHQLVRRHPGLAHRDLRQVELHPDAAAGAHLERRGRQPGRSHVLDRDHGVALEDLEDGFEDELLHERVAHLHGRAALRLPIVERVRSHRRAVDPVAARLRARVEDGVSRAGGLRAEDPVLPHDADRHDVHEDVLVVGRVEKRHPADRRHADAVAVPPDAAHDAVHEVAHARSRGIPEEERVEDRERARAHREDVAQDPADARGRALVGLDEGRVVVGLHLEDDGESVADVHGARVLAGALQDARAGGRELLQVGLRGLVRAVLAPERRVDPQLHEVRVAAEDLPDPQELVGREPVLGHDGGRQRRGRESHGGVVYWV